MPGAPWSVSHPRVADEEERMEAAAAAQYLAYVWDRREAPLLDAAERLVSRLRRHATTPEAVRDLDQLGRLMQRLQLGNIEEDLLHLAQAEYLSAGPK